MVSSRYFNYLILFFIPFGLSAQFEAAFKTQTEYRLRIIDSIYEINLSSKDTISRQKQLVQLKILANKAGDLESALLSDIYALKLMPASDSTSRQTILNRFYEILHQSKETKLDRIHIIALVEMGHMVRRFRDNGASFTYLLKAHELLKNTDTTKLVKRARAVDFMLGLFYYEVGEYQKALFFLEHDIKPWKNNHYQMLVHALISQTYLNLGDYQCSLYHIEEAKKIYRTNDTTTWFFRGWNGVFKGYLAKIFYYQGNYQKAIPLFSDAINISSYAKMYENVCGFGLLLVDCYLRENKFNNARDLLTQIQPALSKSGNVNNFRDYYKMMILLPWEKADGAQTDQLLDSINYWNIKLKKHNDQNALLDKEMASELEFWDKKNIELMNKIQKQKEYRIIILGILLLLFGLTCVKLFRDKVLLKKQKAFENSIKYNAIQTLQESEQQLMEFREILIKKNQQIEFLEANNNLISSNSELEIIKAGSILSNEDWDQFKELFDKVYPGYITRLTERYSQLTLGEFRFMVLARLSLNNKEIASCLGVSPGAIRTLKSRLFKKLKLEEHESIEVLTSLI